MHYAEQAEFGFMSTQIGRIVCYYYCLIQCTIAEAHGENPVKN